jgi:hypothetical protein
MLRLRTEIPTVNGALPGLAAPSEIVIRSHGIAVGRARPDVVTAVTVPAGWSVPLEALWMPNYVGGGSRGGYTLTVGAGERRELEIQLLDGKEFGIDAELVFDQARNGVLNQDFSSAVFRFVEDGRPLAVAQLTYVRLRVGPTPRPGDDWEEHNVTDLFALRDGLVTCTRSDALRALVSRHTGSHMIDVRAEDKDGRILSGGSAFYMGEVRIRGSVEPSRSNPGAASSGVKVQLKAIGAVMRDLVDFYEPSVLEMPIVVEVTTDAQGNFEAPLMPRGRIEVMSDYSEADGVYRSRGVAEIGGDVVITVRDRSDGIPFMRVNAGARPDP